MMRCKLNILGTKAEVRMWVLGACVWEKFSKTEFKERKGSRHLRQRNGEQCWRQEADQGQLVMYAATERDVKPACLFKGRMPCIPSCWSSGITRSAGLEVVLGVVVIVVTERTSSRNSTWISRSQVIEAVVKVWSRHFYSLTMVFTMLRKVFPPRQG